MCVFVGYNVMHKGYICLDRRTSRIYISRDVIFDEVATAGTVIDFTTLLPVHFPAQEPAI
jgi:hypothetical protein